MENRPGQAFEARRLAVLAEEVPDALRFARFNRHESWRRVLATASDEELAE